jgi:hypothetical protein
MPATPWFRRLMQGDQEPELYSETLSQKKKKRLFIPMGSKDCWNQDPDGR